MSDSLLHKVDVKCFFVKGQKTVKLSRSGDTAKNVGHRALEYIDKKNGETFEAVVLLRGMNDTGKKKADIKSAAKELTKTAEKLLEKSNVKRVFISKVLPRLDSEANDLKMSQFNQLIADFVTERNNETLVMVETVNKEIKNFNPRDGLHLTKLGVRRLSAILLKTLYCAIRSE